MFNNIRVQNNRGITRLFAIALRLILLSDKLVFNQNCIDRIHDGRGVDNGLDKC